MRYGDAGSFRAKVRPGGAIAPREAPSVHRGDHARARGRMADSQRRTREAGARQLPEFRSWWAHEACFRGITPAFAGFRDRGTSKSVGTRFAR